MIAPLVLLLACAGRPETLADCAGLRDEADREECRFQLVSPLLPDPNHPAPDRKAFQRALDEALAQIEDPRSRDLLLLRLAISSPATAGYLCTKVETEGARQRCQQVLGRPHLGTVPKAPQSPGVLPATAGPTPDDK